MKRIIVCCDGTYEDGTIIQDTSQYTNVLRLARSIRSNDTRDKSHTIPQIVFYQAGIGSENNFYTQYLQSRQSLHKTDHLSAANIGGNIMDKARELYVNSVGSLEGATGAPLAEKVEEAYAFIAQNYDVGDEIFLFGFSRGAYTARMIAAFIGKIGILHRECMDHFGAIFVEYQMLGKLDQADEDVRVKLKNLIHKYRVKFTSEDLFSIKCVGVFDTVGSIGWPGEIGGFHSVKHTIFGFSDNYLGLHIEKAYHALALDEKRKDFVPIKFLKQKEPNGQYKKNQILKQCWFTGVHCDIGGGYRDHDLSDLSLIWMAANINDILALDIEYLQSIPKMTAPQGELPPHDSLSGLYAVAARVPSRDLPTSTDEITHETIHPSVLKQLPDALKSVYSTNPKIVSELLDLEKQIWDTIQYVPGKYNRLPKADQSGPNMTALAKEEIKKIIEEFHSRLM